MEKMILKVENELQEDFEIPTHVDMWYDKHTKLWILQTKDKYDNQVGDAEYISGKQSALKTKEERENSIMKRM